MTLSWSPCAPNTGTPAGHSAAVGTPASNGVEYSLTPRGRPVAERLIELFAHIEDQIPDVVDTRREFDKRARQS